MLRRTLLLLPALGIVVAWLGTVLPPTGAIVIGAAGGFLVAVGLATADERRAARVADRVVRFADGDTTTRITPRGSVQWRRLVEGLNAVGVSLQQRFAELADERARVERLLDTVPTALLLFTGDGLAYANPAARQLFRLPDTAARTAMQVLGVQGLADAVAEARETEQAIEVEVQREHLTLQALATVTGPDEVALVITDLSESRRIDEIRRDFVTNASHELKTPAAGMQALADSLGLAIRRDPDRAVVMIRRLQREAERLSVLVRDLLDLARLEEVAAQRARQRVDVRALLHEQVRRLDPVARERGVKVSIDAGEGATVVAVPEDVRLIAGNLLENAVRYNREGGRVDVTVRRNGSELELVVADTGIGIPEADRDRVFERFYRVDKARSRAAGGTGLGLALVRHAVQRHGGEVTVRSVLGEGSTFRVVLPVEGARANTV